jgi:hypothetical protein
MGKGEDWLDTAADVGTFLTEAKELKVARASAKTTAKQLKLQEAQLALERKRTELQSRQNDLQAEQLRILRRQEAKAEDDQLVQETALAVTEGRMTPDEAAVHLETVRFNKHASPPRPGTRIVPPVSAGNMVGLGGGTPGWYLEGLTRVRYWDGEGWTLQIMKLSEARKLNRAASKEEKAQTKAMKAEKKDARAHAKGVRAQEKEARKKS